jgi:hypothetical protein
MNKLINNMERASNVTVNAKGAKSNRSSLNSCVDLFGSIGSMRARSDGEVIKAFTNAFGEDPLVATRIAFWVRDIRGGAGERKVFRTIIKYLATAHTKVLSKNLHLIHEYGRWDDYFVLDGTPVWDDVVDLILNQLQADLDSETPSLLAKWMKSNNTSSKESRRLANYFAKEIGWTAKQYRKNLSMLRAKIKVVEQQMCAGDWENIEYQRVPSRAAMIYRKAFDKHDSKGYQKYLSDVEAGKVEIKATTLYPYDIVRNVLGNGYYGGKTSYNKTIDLQWKALPNYVEPFNGLVVCDTSGSMYSSGYYGGKGDQVRPIDVAVSLSIYIAERNTGFWKDYYLPFSSSAKLAKIKGSNIYEKVSGLGDGYMGSTNLQAAFDLILDTAVKHNVSPEDMPEKLFIISDMQFDQACSSNKRSNFEQIEKKYRKAGYKRPELIFWNVNAYAKDTPVVFDDMGTAMVSGASPSILKSVLSGEVVTPLDVMLETVNGERYEKVTI